MNERFVLVADCVDGTWDGVVRAWCEATGEEALCLAADEKRATAYLVVAKYEEEVRESLLALRLRELPVVWINDFRGQVVRYPSVQAALEALS